ncbi:MAG: hypothetical protein KGL70_12595 [Betaproteobacteria bacterium]|nr:hypothetical protein [Betaproteobacteria bacterium]MDE2003636.1 hypothetical protein [Betaproteobacteria bacterium]MDE2210408.1 hypothetical protein [Betaproteobacteria bacterium]MDE2360210.1 hypothetical protein [Betaproteobacteria bacterium]
MLKRLVLLVALVVFAALRADAREYTDVYFDPSEPGWGVFLVQSDTTQFLAFYIYGADGKPIWYTALLSDDGTGNYAGPLYATTGTYFANPWQGYKINAAGTVSFRPTDSYHAMLTYTVNGAGTVTKSIQRETLTPYVLSGTYSTSVAGAISGCTDPTHNEPAFRASGNLTVAQVGDQSATLAFAFTDPVHNGIVCTVSGPLTHLGRLYQLNGQATCGGNSHATTIDALHPTGQGIEGHWTGGTGGGCTGSLHFAAVLDVNN